MDPVFAFTTTAVTLGFFALVIALHSGDKDVSIQALKTLFGLRPPGPPTDE